MCLTSLLPPARPGDELYGSNPNPMLPEQVHLAYVNHKCVPLDDKSSTHQKARFVMRWVWGHTALRTTSRSRTTRLPTMPPGWGGASKGQVH